MAAQYSIIPAPVTLIQQPGMFSFNDSTILVADNSLKKVADMAKSYFHLKDGSATKNAVLLKVDRSLKLNEEGYRLIVDTDTVEIQGKSTAGVFYGLQSLRQLMPTEGWNGAHTFDVPAVIIEDQPRFSWRGAHLDVGRNFMPMSFIKKFIDRIFVCIWIAISQSKYFILFRFGYSPNKASKCFPCKGS